MLSVFSIKNRNENLLDYQSCQTTSALKVYEKHKIQKTCCQVLLIQMVKGITIAI